jgi:hypothetical protein
LKEKRITRLSLVDVHQMMQTLLKWGDGGVRFESINELVGKI